MIPLFNAIHWNPDPWITYGDTHVVRWYGLLFSIGVVFAYFIVSDLYNREKIDEKYMTYLLFIVVGAAVIGARLGEVFFYNWDYYKDHTDEILKTWQGGLSSHGATIGIFIAVIIYSQWIIKKNFLWVADRAVIGIAMTAAFVRLGNFANSEIIGKPADLPWSVIFDSIDAIPRHPTQIYEFIAYAVLSVFLYILFRKKGHELRTGTISGLFLIMMFSFRFLVEFFKENQVEFEGHWSINQGQRLSIPFILIGICFLAFNAYQKRKSL